MGQAGLLNGYRATSHWPERPLLEEYGAIEVDQPVVFDRNRATGAGVSAGPDFALALIQRLRPLEFAQAVQLLLEYAPEPSLDNGTPDRAPAAVLVQARELTADFVKDGREAALTCRSNPRNATFVTDPSRWSRTHLKLSDPRVADSENIAIKPR